LINGVFGFIRKGSIKKELLKQALLLTLAHKNPAKSYSTLHSQTKVKKKPGNCRAFQGLST
jgi:hypothetical protein